jgi:ribosomal protein L7/L12
MIEHKLVVKLVCEQLYSEGHDTLAELLQASAASAASVEESSPQEAEVSVYIKSEHKEGEESILKIQAIKLIRTYKDLPLVEAKSLVEKAMSNSINVCIGSMPLTKARKLKESLPITGFNCLFE